MGKKSQNRPNVKQKPKHSNRQPKDTSSKFLGHRECLLLGLVTTLLGFVFLAVIWTNYVGQRKPRQVSDVLKELVDHSKRQQDFDFQTQKLLIADPFTDIVKTELQPIQDKLASIKKQASLYEQMEQIPGGPVTFIENALKALTAIGDIHVTRLYEKGGTIIIYKKNAFKALIGDSRSLTQTPGLDDESYQMLANEQIFITGGDPKILNATFEQVLGMVQSLLYKHGIKDDTELSSLEESIQEDITQYVNSFKELRSKIETDIEVNGKYYPLMYTYKFEALTKSAKDIEAIRNYEYERRGPYMKLVDLVKTDAYKTKSRVLNLKRATARKTEL